MINHLPSPLFKLLLAVGFAISPITTKAQLGVNVANLFSATAQKPRVIRLKPNGIKVPRGGHLQGIQRLNDSVLVITASSGSYSYYLTALFNTSSGKGKLTAIHKITKAPFHHAGGCQLYEHTLAVGAEDNYTKDKSEILLITLDDNGNETWRSIIAKRQGKVKRSTAGAVAFTKLKNGQYMVIVADWDSKNLDVYLSKKGLNSVFDSITTLHITDWPHIPSYQALNLICDLTGNIYLAGFALWGTQNRADLFRLDIARGLSKISCKATCIYNCRGGAGFRFASGINAPGKQLIIYTCGRGTLPLTTVNIFNPPIP